MILWAGVHSAAIAKTSPLLAIQRFQHHKPVLGKNQPKQCSMTQSDRFVGPFVKEERPRVAKNAGNFALFTLAFWLTFLPHEFE
jgi:hypothetical protein